MTETKMWGGRFEQSTDELAAEFQASIGFDKRLARQDIQGSIAHARMLARQGILSQEDEDAIVGGLVSVLEDIQAGRAELTEGDEDIHMNVERLLTQKIGEAGKKLHTGRSRNDQVATDMRLYMLETAHATIGALSELCAVLTEVAAKNTKTVMPAYTHLQKAQPTTLAHYMMAYFEMFLRDIERFADCRRRTDVLPLGSGALCGTTYPLDRKYTAELLGFSQISHNSMDAVSDRDFLLEYLSCASICMMHLSRLAEELVLFSTSEFGFVDLSDRYSTGSSIMPQKRNPDMAELIRGKTGRVYGDLVALLTVMKGLPLAYNKDMQEDKEGVFDAADTLIQCLKVMTGMLSSAWFRAGRMQSAATRGFTNATDAADYLVGKGMPFRDAHAVVGQMVLFCEQNDRSIDELTLDELQTFSPLIEADIHDAVTMETCIGARSLPGGPAPSAVEAEIADAKARLKAAPGDAPEPAG